MAWNARIDRILLAENSVDQHQRGLLARLMPDAEVRSTNNLAEARSLILSWKPVLAVMDFRLADGDVFSLIEEASLIQTIPFILGVSGCATRAETALAVRGGFSHVLDMPFDALEFEQALRYVVTTPAPLAPSLKQVISPFLYATPHRFNIRKFNGEVEELIFQFAGTMTRSKKELARILGISRQLVQYHVRKNG
jgi:DNA-binding response OmpR family regulator